MTYNVSSVEFWKERIEMGKSRGILHHSIYELDIAGWEAVEKRHMALAFEHISVTDDSVLDIACGYGRIAKYFMPRYYTGVDFSEDFIEIAKEHNPHHKFLQADITKLPFEDNTFEWGIGVSIRAMIQREVGEDVWKAMEKELQRVCNHLIFFEYSDGKGNHGREPYEVIHKGCLINEVRTSGI